MFYSERAVEPGVSALPSTLHSYLNYSISRKNSKWIARRPSPELKALEKLQQRDVLGTRAFRTSAFRKRDLLAFTQGVETDALKAR